ncbi:MAG: DUF2231 domain-containing protein [Candidatus Marinimicrobia bacterium]|nr:DUF2231 domain-containing protein [Candidatus Neomarinimicrobiota bacterium]MBL7010915.1 DUF2231 domain-containing protein [Candidatus Neomarinimicrobiota bacterium]MBL7031351.1 DUF2231 domain-containing protein [Candidatus Neomarinimicrobiota bacterium]
MFLDWLPNIHPLIIHAPIVLIPLGFLVHLICLLLKKGEEWKIPIGILYSASLLGVLAAFLSGRQAGDSVTIHPQANLVLSEHADLALWTLGISVIVTTLYWSWIRIRMWSGMPWVILTLSLVNIGSMILTADHGGQLVYRFGTGVSLRVEKEIIAKPVQSAPAVISNSDGSWTWDAKMETGEKHFTSFHFIEGEAENIISESKKSGYYSLTEPVTFLWDKTETDIQMDVQLDVKSFKGKVVLFHHFKSLDQYDFLEISGDEISLGRIVNGKREVMDTEKNNNGDWNRYRVISSGRHYKGFMNEKLVVHGHGSILDPGRVGLRLNGSGTIGLLSIKTISISND